MWKEGDLESLLQEGRAIQRRLRNADHRNKTDKSRTFARLMFAGKIKAVLKIIAEDQCGGPLQPHSLAEAPSEQAKWTVLDELKTKYPEGKPVSQNCIVDQSPNDDIPPNHL